MQTRKAGFVLVFIAACVVVTGARAGEPEDRFWAAAREGDLATIKKLAAGGVDINTGSQYGATALSFAADKGHIEVVRFLLESGADPNKSDTFYQASPMTWASENDHLEVAVLLVEHGAEGSGGLLAKVAAAGRKDLVEKLIKTGKLEPGDLARAMAVTAEKQPEVAALLKEAGAKAVVTVRPALLDEYVGKYEVQPGFILDVRRVDDKLVVQATGQPEFPVYAESEDTFFLTVVDATLIFKRSEQGKVDQVVLNQGGRAMPARRQGSVDRPPVDLSALQKYVGRYESEDGMVFLVTIKDQVFGTGPEGMDPTPLLASGENTFQVASNAEVKVVFTEEDGKVTGYTVDTGTAKLVRKRVDAPEGVAVVAPPKHYDRTKPINWPSFRGPHASGVGDGQGVLTKWSVETGENVKWKTAIPGLGHSSPVVWGDRLFVTTAVSSDPDSEFRAGPYGDVKAAKDTSLHEWKVLCLDAKSGRIIWETTAHRGKPRAERHTKASQANCTPALDGKHVVVSFGSEGLFCYDFDGELLWKQDLGVLDAGWFYDPTYQWGYGSSPVIHENRVIVQCDVNSAAFMAAFHIDSGSELWRTKRDELPSWGTPTLVNSPERAQVIANATRHICGYDPRTGKEIWRLSGNSEVTVGTPVFGHGLMFFTGGYSPFQPIYAVKVGASGDVTLKEGTESNEHVAWSKRRGGTYMPTPIVYEDYLYTCGNSGVLTCYEATTGKRMYRARVAEGKAGSYTASPVAADGKLYLSSEDSGVFVVRAGPKYELLAENPMGEIVMATPAISNGMFFVRTQHHLFGIGK